MVAPNMLQPTGTGVPATVRNRRMPSRSTRRSGLSEERLIDLMGAVALKRDRAAFAELFDHFAPRLKAYGIRAGSDAATAEELAQEAMIAVWRKAESFDDTKAAVSTWVFTIVRNKRIDKLRRERRPEIDPQDLMMNVTPEADASEKYQAAEDQKMLRRSIGQLPAEQAEIVEKAFFEDKSHSVIAEELALPLGTVKSRIRLALSRLRTLVSEDEL